jgi:hypothetical protein
LARRENFGNFNPSVPIGNQGKAGKYACQSKTAGISFEAFRAGMKSICKLTARLDNGDIFEENVSVIWINDKSMIAKVKSAYHRFPIERVMRLEWIPICDQTQQPPSD